MVSTMKTRRLVPDADCLMRSQLCKGTTPVTGPHSYGAVLPPHRLPLTSMAALTAVSEPRLKSVPGTLLLMVAGMTHMMMQSSSYCPRASTSCSTPSYACRGHGCQQAPTSPHHPGPGWAHQVWEMQ